MKTFLNLILIFGLALAVRAQDEVPPPAPAYTQLSAAQLDQLLGPIALYPDPLVSIILPAATFPTEIVMADRYVSGGGDPNAIDQQGWDPSVQALAHYPNVLQWMDNNLNWTTQLGQAFANQQQDVMDSIQRLRTEAYNLGNLISTPQQQVVDDNGYIEILPANPDDVYVPDYQADQVYYQQPYGAPFISFGVGCAIGPWLYCDFDWRNHHLVTWDHDHPRPSDWWHERPNQRAAYFASGHGAVWNGGDHSSYTGGYQGGDRGWNNQDRTVNTQNFHGGQNFQRDNHARANYTAPSPTPAPRFDNSQRPGNDAFIGSQNSRDARSFSNRGEQSMESAGHSAPAFHGSGGNAGGGGSHAAAGGSHAGGNANGGGGGGRR